MLNNKHKKIYQIIGFRVKRNKTVSIRKKEIKSYIMSRCKPGATSKTCFDRVAPFLSSKRKSRRHIILNEDGKIITDTQNVCDVFANLFSTIVAGHIGSDDHIDTSQENYLSNILMKHVNHKSILEIKEMHSDQMAFNFRKV